MQRSIHSILAPPVFADDDQNHRATILNAMGWSTLFIVAVILVIRTVQGQDTNLFEVNLVLIGVMMIIGLVIYLTRRGRIRAAGMIFVTVIWIALSSVAWIADGIRDVTFFGLIIPILLAGLLLGWRTAILVTLASIASGWALAYAESNQFFQPSLDRPLNFARDVTGILALTGILVYLTISGLQKALDRSRMAAEELTLANKDVNDLRMELERRVEERTIELKKRAAQLEAVSSVARAIASVQDLKNLLPAITELISQQFGFYHVCIFLLDEQSGKAIMRASSSAGGMLLVNQGFSLTPDEFSIVGYSILHGDVRIAQDVLTDAVYLNNPNLPETRSEIALPLRVAGRVIGALDVQSQEINSFPETDISVLFTLADQVAIAIENARLFSDARAALNESRVMFEKYTQQDWSNFARQAKQTGYIFDGKNVFPLDRSQKRNAARTVLQTGSLSLEKETATVAIPLKLRGQTIGVLDVRSKKGERTWKQDELTMLQAAAERAALALENARLVESAQRRAARERAIGDISARIGSASQFESILQMAVEELGRKLGGATEVTLEITRDERDGDPFQ